MKKLLGLFCLALVALGRPASADVAFALSPVNQTIVQGDEGIFQLFWSSNNNDLIEGYDFNVNAGAGDGTGGVFTGAAITNFPSPLPGDFTSTPGQVFSTNFTNSPFVLTSTQTLLATLTLNTTGVAPGVYSMTMDSINAGHPTLGALPFTTNSISYEITAVPEPASLMSGLGLAMAGVLNHRRRRRKIK